MNNLTTINDSDYIIMKEDIEKFEKMCVSYEEELKYLKLENTRLNKQLKEMRTLCASLLDQIKDLEN